MFIFGIGYVGLAFARFLHKHKWDVSGTCSSEERRDALEAIGLRAFRFNSDNDGEGLEQEGLQALEDATHMIITVPPVADFDKDPVLFVYGQQLAHIVRYMNLGWIGYLSSTGITATYHEIFSFICLAFLCACSFYILDSIFYHILQESMVIIKHTTKAKR